MLDMNSGPYDCILCSNDFAFVARDSTGGVTTWGDRLYGGDSSKVKRFLHDNVERLYSSRQSFAAVKQNGTIVTWGNNIELDEHHGVIRLQPGQRVRHVYSTSDAFAALLCDGSVITWGSSRVGGDSTSVSTELSTGVIYIVSNDYAFAALKQNGTVVTWGMRGKGGNIHRSVQDRLVDVKAIYANDNASFTAVTSTGKIVSWGIIRFLRKGYIRTIAPTAIV